MGHAGDFDDRVAQLILIHWTQMEMVAMTTTLLSNLVRDLYHRRWGGAIVDGVAKEAAHPFSPLAAAVAC